MNSNGHFQDPYCRKDFWISRLNAKSRTELEDCLRNFERFATEMENELRVAMSVSRAEVCRTVLHELITAKAENANNPRQGDLFGGQKG